MHAKRAGVAQGTRAGRLNSVLHAQQHIASWRSMVEPFQSVGIKICAARHSFDTMYLDLAAILRLFSLYRCSRLGRLVDLVQFAEYPNQ